MVFTHALCYMSAENLLKRSALYQEKKMQYRISPPLFGKQCPSKLTHCCHSVSGHLTYQLRQDHVNCKEHLLLTLIDFTGNMAN